jgi:hypothetical protein
MIEGANFANALSLVGAAAVLMGFLFTDAALFYMGMALIVIPVAITAVVGMRKPVEPEEVKKS